MNPDEVSEISVEDLNNLIQENSNLKLLDVREPFETEICSLSNSLFMPLSTFEEKIHSLNKHDNYIVVCKLGARSYKAASMMLDCGFTNVKNLKGGIIAWAEKIDSSMAIY